MAATSSISSSLMSFSLRSCHLNIYIPLLYQQNRIIHSTAATATAVIVNNRHFNLPSECHRRTRPLFLLTLGGTSQENIERLVGVQRTTVGSTIPSWVTLSAAAATAAASSSSIASNDVDDDEYISDSNWANIQMREESRGMYGLMATVIPSTVGPSLATMLTGVHPEKHGVHNDTFETSTSDYGGPLLVPSVLDVLRCNGLSVSTFAVTATAHSLLRPQTMTASSSSSSSYDLCIEHPNHHKQLLQLINGDTLNHAAWDPWMKEGADSDGSVSLDLLAAAIGALDKCNNDVICVSLSSALQCEHAPNSPVAESFYERIDELLGRIDPDVTMVVTADHSMHGKTNYYGLPRAIFLVDELASIGIAATVELPVINNLKRDTFSGCAYVRLCDSFTDSTISLALNHLRSLSGVHSALSTNYAAGLLALDKDAIGDIIVMGDQDTVFISTKETLSSLPAQTPLRSHGSPFETTVPLLVNRPLLPEYAQRLGSGRMHTVDLFDMICNGFKRGNI